MAESVTKMYSIELVSPEFLREKFENDLEISGKTQAIWSLKDLATLDYRHFWLSRQSESKK